MQHEATDLSSIQDFTMKKKLAYVSTLAKAKSVIDLNEALHERAAELEQLREEAEAAERNFEERQQELTDLVTHPLKEQNAFLKQQQQDFVKHITALRNQNGRLRFLASMSLNAGAQNRSLTKELEVAKRKEAKAEQEKEELKKVVESQREIIIRVERSSKAEPKVAQEIDRKQAMFDFAMRTRDEGIEVLKHKRAEVQIELGTMTKDRDRWERKFNQLKENHDKCKPQKLQLMREVEKLHKEHRQMQELVYQYKEEVIEKSKLADSMEKELDTVQDQMEKNTEANEAKREQMQKKIADERSTVSKLRKDHKSLTVQFAKLQEDYSQLRRRTICNEMASLKERRVMIEILLSHFGPQVDFLFKTDKFFSRLPAILDQKDKGRIVYRKRSSQFINADDVKLVPLLGVEPIKLETVTEISLKAALIQEKELTASLREDVADLHEEIASNSKTMRELELRCAQLEAKLHKTNANMKQANINQKNAENNLADVTKQFDAFKAEHPECQYLLRAAAQEQRKLARDAEHLADQKHELEHRLKFITASHESCAGIIQAARDEINLLNIEVQTLRSENSTVNSRFSNVGIELTVCREAASNLEIERAKLQQTVRGLQEERERILASLKHNDDMRTEMSIVQAQNIKFKEALKQSSENLKQFQDLYESARPFKAQYLNSQRSLTAAEASLVDMKQINAQLLADLRQESENLAEYSKKIQDMDKSFTALQLFSQDHQNCGQTVHDLRLQLSELGKAHAPCENTLNALNKLRGEHELVQRELRDAEAKILEVTEDAFDAHAYVAQVQEEFGLRRSIEKKAREFFATLKLRLGMQFLKLSNSVNAVSSGLQVTSVEADGPCGVAGIKSKDFITQVNGCSVGSPQQFFDAVKDVVPGDSCAFLVSRGSNPDPIQIIVRTSALDIDRDALLMLRRLAEFSLADYNVANNFDGLAARMELYPHDSKVEKMKEKETKEIEAERRPSSALSRPPSVTGSKGVQPQESFKRPPPFSHLSGSAGYVAKAEKANLSLPPKENLLA